MVDEIAPAAPGGQRQNQDLGGSDFTTQSDNKHPRLAAAKNRNLVLEQIAVKWSARGLYQTQCQAMIALLCQMNVTRRPELQSPAEWLADYESSPVPTRDGHRDGAVIVQVKPVVSIFEYAGFYTRTDQRGKGRLVLELIDIQSGQSLPAFFNVNITYQRGPMAGQNFKVGRNGRFWLYPRSKFALFWLSTVGQTDKWSRVYRQLNRLKAYRFTGVVRRTDTYCQIIDLQAFEDG